MGCCCFRWFHDGCCECVGHTCINYGINESRCLECPGEDEDNPVDSESSSFGGAEDDEEDKEAKAKAASKMEDKSEKPVGDQVTNPPAV